MTVLVQQQLREATGRVIAEGENCWPATVERFAELLTPENVLALLDELDQFKAENTTLLGALKETNHCLVACLTGGEVSAKRAGKAIEAAATAIDQAMTKEQQP